MKSATSTKLSELNVPIGVQHEWLHVITELKNVLKKHEFINKIYDYNSKFYWEAHQEEAEKHHALIEKAKYFCSKNWYFTEKMSNIYREELNVSERHWLTICDYLTVAGCCVNNYDYIGTR
tara:strand:- start:789 stop:1151 length:363 start_codon:yes stop_codon:yes gene_type:complete